MKIGKMTVVYSCIFSLMLGTGLILSQISAPTYKASVKFDPRTYVLDSPYPNPWNAVIGFTHGYKAEDIDTTSIWLSDPEAPSEPIQPIGTAIVKGKLLAMFEGEGVWRCIWRKIIHLFLGIVGRLRLLFRITLSALDGTVFEGNGIITVIVPEPPPPIPP